MKRPIESDYTSHVAYTRALEEYCDSLPQLAQEPVATVIKKQLTPWFPSSIKPVHIGVYETEMEGVRSSKGFSFWNGKCWGNTEDLPEWALDGIGIQTKKWRGLQEKP